MGKKLTFAAGFFKSSLRLGALDFVFLSNKSGANSFCEMKLITWGYPAWFLSFGLLVFYSAMGLPWWFSSSGHLTLTGLAALVMGLGLLLAGGQFFRMARENYRLIAKDRVLWALGALLALYLAAAFFYAFKPSHLAQESDFLNYHLMLPKQNWLIGSWWPIEWSGFEFRSMLIQYGLSYLWMGLPLLNRMPQFLLFLFFLLRLAFLFQSVKGSEWFKSWIFSVAFFLSFRGVAFQVGTAMLDLPALYFTVALVHWFFLLQKCEQKLSRTESLLLGIEFVGYVSLKAFSMIYLLPLTVLALLSIGLKPLVKLFSKISWAFWLPVFVLWLPSLVRSFYFTGDPFFPFTPKVSEFFCSSQRFHEISCADIFHLRDHILKLRYSYGYGHGVKDFIKAVIYVGWPKDGPSPVNNIFDYPLGALWYICGFALLAALGKWHRQYKISRNIFISSAIFFVIWFEGSQQSRWLYPVLLALAIHSALLIPELPAKARTVFFALLVFNLGGNTVRVLKSQRDSIKCFGEACLVGGYHYNKDYDQTCDAKGRYQATELNDRGYLNCVIDAMGQKQEY